MKLGEQLGRAAERLAAAGIEGPRREARWLLAHVLEIAPGELALRLRQPLPPAAGRRLEALIEQRCRRRPLQYLLGSWPFLDFDVKCDERALVPRPETEDLALLVSEQLAAGSSGRLLDVGTGGGCIALALARRHPALEILAVDSDGGALSLARENLRRAGLADRVGLLRSDLLTGLGGLGPGAFVVANLPYVTEAEWEELQPEVRDHEPRQALVAADDGLALIRKLAEQAAGRLGPGGRMALEMAPGQTSRMAAELAAAGWEQCRIHRDRFDRPRIVTARRGR
ncbi:MAG: peptide chain release factor N(5)-glutamine methyltransferase [Acidobacteriota bacterium]|nr:peptide chain release factor N(5)-glutamine methyltransferase [Acidobacteriota bacterium]MDQ7087373.1 peptide chain release factor N(5)-glutamine methyltransferase [Acidobacteriota bacterium]